MGEKIILGCAWCLKFEDVELSMCCRVHGRLVCDDCRKDPFYEREHQPAAKAS